MDIIKNLIESMEARITKLNNRASGALKKSEDAGELKAAAEADMWRVIKKLNTHGYGHPTEQLHDALRVGELAAEMKTAWEESQRCFTVYSRAISQASDTRNDIRELQVALNDMEEPTFTFNSPVKA